jgi:hypothetical protein
MFAVGCVPPAACTTTAMLLIPLLLLRPATGSSSGDGTAANNGAKNKQPSIIFCADVDKLYLRHILASGIQVDYGSVDDCGNRTRLWQYTAAVVSSTPGHDSQCSPSCDPAKARAFAATLQSYAVAGGGILLMPQEMNVKKQQLFEVTESFQIKLPLDLLSEINPLDRTRMQHLGMEMAYTSNITGGSPVTVGVKQVWYPLGDFYNGQATNPLMLVDPSWACLVHGMETTTTAPLDIKRAAMQPPPEADRSFLPNGTVAPCLMASRRCPGGGRVAALNMWSQFTIGSGLTDYYLFHMQIMKSGDGTRQSDMSLLLDNLWKWLSAAPASSTTGGFITNETRLMYSNEMPGAMDAYNETNRQWPEEELIADPSLWPNEQIFHGVIGLKTTHGSGSSTVAEYAAAAAGLNLQFLVFIDEYKHLTNESLEALKVECKSLSTPNLTLWAGYSMPNNIGNYMMNWGPDVKLPPLEFMQPCDCQCALPNGIECPAFEIQPMNDVVKCPNASCKPNSIPAGCTLDCKLQLSNGTMSGQLGKSFQWDIIGASGRAGNNLGYYNFSRNSHGMQMSDFRGYSSAAVMYYANGQLVEDNTEQYLLTWEGTMGPCPIAFNQVDSVTELQEELDKGHSITHIRAKQLDEIWNAGLRWDDQYDYMPVFVGPMSIKIWAFGISPSAADGSPVGPGMAPSADDVFYGSPTRVQTVGAARFISNRAVSETTISVQSTVPLNVVSIYNGQTLFRRFGPKHEPGLFYRTLLLNGVVQKNLILVVEDADGNKAITYAWKMWKDSGFHREPVFCSDHVNDCNGAPLLARGPFVPPLTWVEPIPSDQVGISWDGGNGAEVTKLLVSATGTRPTLTTTAGETESGNRFTGVPRLESSDEGCVLTSSEQGKVFSDKIVNVLNSWNTWGPFKGPARLFNFTARSRLLFAANTGWVRDGWAAMPQSAGMMSQQYVLDVTIKKALTIQSLALWSLRVSGALATTLVYGLTPFDKKGTIVVLKEGNPARAPQNFTAQNLTMPAGAWFFFVSPNASATHMFYVQDRPVHVEITSDVVTATAMTAGQVSRSGESFRYSLLSFGVTLQTNLQTVGDTLALHNYLMRPAIQTLGGGAKRNRTRAPLLAFSAGNIMDLQPAHVVLPKPTLPHGDTVTRSIGALVPLQLCDLNPHWAVGLYQAEGYVEPGYYNGTGTHAFGQNRYTALGLDKDNCAWAPLYVDRANSTNITIGHPVVISGGRNQSLWPQVFIDVVKLSDSHNLGTSDSWHVTANNPTDTGFSVTFISKWEMPGFPISHDGNPHGHGGNVYLPPKSIVTVARS